MLYYINGRTIYIHAYKSYNECNNSDLMFLVIDLYYLFIYTCSPHLYCLLLRPVGLIVVVPWAVAGSFAEMVGWWLVVGRLIELVLDGC